MSCCVSLTFKDLLAVKYCTSLVSQANPPSWGTGNIWAHRGLRTKLIHCRDMSILVEAVDRWIATGWSKAFKIRGCDRGRASLAKCSGVIGQQEKKMHKPLQNRSCKSVTQNILRIYLCSPKLWHILAYFADQIARSSIPSRSPSSPSSCSGRSSWSGSSAGSWTAGAWWGASSGEFDVPFITKLTLSDMLMVKCSCCSSLSFGFMINL